MIIAIPGASKYYVFKYDRLRYMVPTVVSTFNRYIGFMVNGFSIRFCVPRKYLVDVTCRMCMCIQEIYFL
jgi:hypothetical protein